MIQGRLTLIALCCVHEAKDAAFRGPVTPSYGLRLALGYLSAGRAREPFLTFYQAATADHQEEADRVGAITRYQSTTAAWNGIVSALGFPEGVHLDRLVRQYRERTVTTAERQAFVQLFHETDDHRRGDIAAKRFGRVCDKDPGK